MRQFNLSRLDPNVVRAIIAESLGVPAQGGKSPDAAKIEAAYIGFSTMLHNRLKKAASQYREIAMVLQTDNLLDRMLWLQSTPKMRLWLGDKTLNMLRGESLPIVTRPHEASLEIPKNDIINDRFGLYTGRIGDIGDAFPWALDELAIVMIAAGIAGTALGTTYDGQNLVDTDHTALSAGGTQQSNKVTGAFSQAVYQTAWQRYLGIQDENGVPQNIANRPMRLLHGPANRDIVRTVLKQDFQASGARNIDYGTAEPLLSPWITSGTRNVLGTSVTLTGLEWALIPESSAAVIIQIKRAAEFLSVEDGEFAFRTGKYLYGIEAEFGATYGLWQEIVGGPGS